MGIEAILTFAIAVGALAIKPGAGMMMVMSRAIAQGFGAVLAFVLGFCVVSILFLGLVIYGYQFIAVDIVFISILIKSLTATYLIWLGVKGVMKAQERYYMEDLKIQTMWDNFSASIMLTLSNPLTIVFYAGILPSVVDIESIGLAEFNVLSLTIIVVEFAVAIAYSCPLLLYRKKATDNFLRGLTLFSSIVLILVGLYIGYMAVAAEDLQSVF